MNAELETEQTEQITVQPDKRSVPRKQSRERKGYGKIAIKMIAFLLIGALLFALVQELFRPRWNYPNFFENTSSSITTYMNMEESTEQVLFFGTSHVLFSISPIMLYDETGIVSYNLATSAQFIEGTYYLMKEALKTQSPEVIVMDVSNLFFEEDTARDADVSMRYVIDSIPFSANKIELAKTYAELADVYDGVTDTDYFERFLSVVFPLIQYHGRWTDLNSNDFTDYINTSNRYTAGYYISSRISEGAWDADSMNEEAELMAEDTTEYQITYSDGIREETTEEDALYDPQVNDYVKGYLTKIKELCDENGCELLLIKVPSINGILDYTSAWTKIKSDRIREVAEEYGVTFLDMLYDVDLKLNVNLDYSDGGNHMNVFGATKVTGYLGQYLQSTYGLEAQESAAYDEMYGVYSQVSSVVQLEMTTSFTTYMARLKAMGDNLLVSIVVGNDAKANLTAEEIAALHDLGLNLDFDNELQQYNSYIAVVDGGEVVYESTSNRELTYEYTDGTTELELSSVGYYSGASSSVLVNGEEYSRNKRGFNIVVVDKESGLVVDTVVFDTYSTRDHDGNRSLSVMKDLWGTYEQYQVDKFY